MSKNWIKAKAKKQKKEIAIKKSKQKKIRLLCVCAAILIIIASGLIVFLNRSRNTEIYSYHGQTVQLFNDGKFTAALAHNVSKNGTYTKAKVNDRTVISFNVNGNTEVGWIINDSLNIPEEWKDSHGHGSVFPRANKASPAESHNH
ncbi:MAG: hypothetical protein LBH16_05570 [Treponema sp.]|jgi:hypothetical protein|nr:hypothetical protein [Treponema sp.]